MEAGHKKEPEVGGEKKNWRVAESGKNSRQKKRVCARTGRMGLWSSSEEEWKRPCMPRTQSEV